MISKTKNIFRAISFFVVCIQLFVLFVPVVFAIDVGSVSSVLGSKSIAGNGDSGQSGDDSVMGKIEKRYHLNADSIRDYGETMNVATNKEAVPQVSLFFQPTNPKPGEAITAQAFPMYFSNPKEKLYFTWYLKREQCKIGNADNENKDVCDPNKDGKVTVEDWKIIAMRSVAQAGYDASVAQADYNAKSNDDDGYAARFGGDRSESIFCYLHDFDEGLDYEIVKNDRNENGCEHLFPDARIGGISKTTGDGSFNNNEEEFWLTDPQDPSTAKNSIKDEANVVGLGQDRFTWNYAPGDKVGVVVEGLSMLPTKYPDSSLKIMWAMPKNECPVGSNIPTLKGEKPDIFGSKTENVKGHDVTIPTIQYDLNNCLEENLIDPTENVAEKLEVQLDASPSLPAIHPLRGNMLSVQSTLSNAVSKQTALQYRWDVSINKRASATADSFWTNITQILAEQKLLTRAEGSGISNLKMNLKFDPKVVLSREKVCKGESACVLFDGTKSGYLRIGLTVTEQIAGGKERIGRSFVIVKITSFDQQVEVRTIGIGADGSLTLPESSAGGSVLCDSDDPHNIERAVCPVSRGQIVGIFFNPTDLIDKGDDQLTISWTLNNKILECTKRVSSSACDPENTDFSKKDAFGLTNFFPVTGDAGELYTVVMTAVNHTNGKSVTLNRVFRIVEPSVKIVATGDASKTWPRYLGFGIDPEGNQSDDYSTEVFEAYAGGTVLLTGVFTPGWLLKDAQAIWVVDGVEVTGDEYGNLVFPASTMIGSVMNVKLLGEYSPSEAVRKALASIWGIVSPAETGETILSDAVQVETMTPQDDGSLTTLGGAKKFFAGIIAYVPDSVLFAFRLGVTLSLILILLAAVFSAVPDRSAFERKIG